MSQHTQIHYWSAPHFREGIKIRYRSARHSQTSHSKKDKARLVIKQNLSKMTTATQILITVLCKMENVLRCMLRSSNRKHCMVRFFAAEKNSSDPKCTLRYRVVSGAEFSPNVDDWLNSLTHNFAAYISQPSHNLPSRRSKHKCLLCLHNFIRLALCTCGF